MDPISTKLSKIIPLLSSDQPGEVVAAAAAVGRVLSEAKLDWHWLSGKLVGAATSNPWSFSETNELRSLRLQLTSANRVLELVRREVASVRTEVAQRNKTIGELRAEVQRLRASASSREEASSNDQDEPEKVHPRVRAARPEGPPRPDAGNWRFRAEHLLEHDANLRPRSREFLESILGQGRRRLSEGQAKWLNDLWQEYRERRARRAGVTSSSRPHKTGGPPPGGWKEFLDDELPF